MKLGLSRLITSLHHGAHSLLPTLLLLTRSGAAYAEGSQNPLVLSRAVLLRTF